MVDLSSGTEENEKDFSLSLWRKKPYKLTSEFLGILRLVSHHPSHESPSKTPDMHAENSFIFIGGMKVKGNIDGDVEKIVNIFSHFWV